MKAIASTLIVTLGLGYEMGLNLSDSDKEKLKLDEDVLVGMGLHGVVGGVPPSSVNWAHAMNPVKHQGSCGSCWAFAAADALSGRWNVKNNELIDVSEKHFLDCTYPDSYDGCTGGNTVTATKNVARKGVAAENTYRPYNAKDENCMSDSEFDRVKYRRKLFAGTSRNDPVIHEYFSGTNELKMEVAKYGPCFFYLGADQAFHDLRGARGNNIWRCGGTGINHAVTLVGYGTQNGEPYWLIKNSWGTGWGNNGFGKVSINSCSLGHSVIAKCPEVRKMPDLSQFTKLPNHFPKWAKCHFTFENCEGNNYDECKKTGAEMCERKNCAGWSVMQERFFPYTDGKGTVMLYYDHGCIVDQMTNDGHWETYVKERQMPCCPEDGNGRGHGTCTPGHCSCWPHVNPNKCSTKTCQVWQCCDPNPTCRDRCKVTLYQHDFEGASRAYGIGNVPQVWIDNTVSSVKVEGAKDCKVELFAHPNYAGWNVKLGEGYYDLATLRRYGFYNDQLSSIKVYRASVTDSWAYKGCYVNKAPYRVSGHIEHITWAECRNEAVKSGKQIFGMEYPQGSAKAGEAQCLILDSRSQYRQMPKVSESECEAEAMHGGKRLGGAHRLAVYQLSDDTAGWHLAPRGAAKCDYGVVATQSECDAAVQILASLLGGTPGRGLQAGRATSCGGRGWGLVPLGCSAQTGGDWAAHFSVGPAECSHEAYQLVCSNDGRRLEIDDTLEAPMPWMNTTNLDVDFGPSFEEIQAIMAEQN